MLRRNELVSEVKKVLRAHISLPNEEGYWYAYPVDLDTLAKELLERIEQLTK